VHRVLDHQSNTDGRRKVVDDVAFVNEFIDNAGGEDGVDH
jgi:hypothetical protein